MSDDLRLIKQLEEETGIKFKQVPMGKIGAVVNGFATDNKGRVQGLVIWHEKLSPFPEFISKLQLLEKLIIYNTQISDISSLKELKRLTYLHLSNNKISDISSFKELKRLTTLILSNNQISDISSLKELKRLTFLNLTSNQISDISCLIELKELTELNLIKNQISDISSLKELKFLKKIYLMDNKITHMPAEFLDLGLDIDWGFYPPYEGIFLEGNPLKSPPMEIIKKGNQAIREYFNSLSEKPQALNEVKVLLVGDGAAGKTSLM
ncbi:MAG: leucine-rich repeat protein, partial [bacterium]|nr:leucine-rich repeat protein [bacterium]